jgi:hypothetical protein
MNDPLPAWLQKPDPTKRILAGATQQHLIDFAQKNNLIIVEFFSTTRPRKKFPNVPYISSDVTAWYGLTK